MIDSVIKGTGDSRYLKSSIAATATWADALTMLRAGTFPIDLNGINSSGFTTVGTALNADTLCKAAILTALGLDSDDTPSDAWEAVLTLIGGKQDSLTFDDAPASGSDNPVKSGGIYTALAGKQDVLTFDSTPTSGSTNPVTSGGVYTALGSVATKTASITIASSAWSGSGPYTASVTISGYTATANTRVDITCPYSAISALADDGVTALYVENNSGTLTAYAVGAAPTANITVTATIYETTTLS